MIRSLPALVVLGCLVACGGGSPPPALVPETTPSAIPTTSSTDVPTSATAAVGTGVAALPSSVPSTVPSANPGTDTAKGSADFPLPKDAGAPSAAPGGGGKISVYQVPRGRDVVVTEVKDALKQGGWTLVKDDPSPSGRAIRLEAKKGDKTYKVSFTGDATKTALILTSP
ncbi:MAG: hypothetical protein HOO96_00910 [Polyangiaceae bacterium]|nr:hypothetical protein [Polyangiaceae bacterium]